MATGDWYEPDQTYECAFCGRIIEHVGWDPCQVDVTASRRHGDDPGMWWFWAHAACVPKAFSPDLRRQVGDDYGPPRFANPPS